MTFVIIEQTKSILVSHKNHALKSKRLCAFRPTPPTLHLPFQTYVDRPGDGHFHILRHPPKPSLSVDDPHSVHRNHAHRHGHAVDGVDGDGGDAHGGDGVHGDGHAHVHSGGLGVHLARGEDGVRRVAHLVHVGDGDGVVGGDGHRVDGQVDQRVHGGHAVHVADAGDRHRVGV